MLPSFNNLKQNLKKPTNKFKKVNVALIGDSTTNFLATAIKGLGFEYRLKVNLFESDYNQIEQLVMNNSSELYKFNAEYVILFQSSLKLLNKVGDSSGYDKLVKERIDFIKVVAKKINSKVICLNYPEIDDLIFGSYASKVNESFVYQLRKLNLELMNLSQTHQNLFICDIASLQNKYGRDSIFSPQLYVSFDLVFSIDFLPHIADKIISIINSLNGSLKKCIVLDLDNTLWGGVIGDDGIEGIQIGNDLGIGKAFHEFQKWIKKLKSRGIIIAICSKNNEETAKEPFLNHPDMVLNLEDISVFIANWENKVDNIKQIQSILNIGFDSMVFIDDNPMERAIVQENIPEILVPDLPKDPSEYLEFFYGLNIFEIASLSNNDTKRTKQYKEEANRITFKKQYADEKSFLKSIKMVASFSQFDSYNIPRVAQLSQRTNQFNLTTIRYTEDEIFKISNDKNYQNLAISLKDKFGNYGLICVIILKKSKNKTLTINSWFMSCRVIKRGLEDLALSKIIDYCKENNYIRIIGEYVQTHKNKVVENHYSNLGFKLLNKGNKTLYELKIEDYIKQICFIKPQ